MNDILTSSIQELTDGMHENIKQFSPNNDNNFMIEFRGFRYFVSGEFDAAGWHLSLWSDELPKQLVFSVVRFGMVCDMNAFTHMEISILGVCQQVYLKHLRG